MDLTGFYALMAGTCFTLVGLWWTVIQQHPDWRNVPRKRRLAGGTYLSFLLPGLMATLATVAPDTPLLWRVSFVSSALVGLWTTAGLLRVGPGPAPARFGRHRWVVLVLYAAILVLGVAPEVVRGLGVTPLVVGSVLLVLLIVVAHALTWEFMMEPDARVSDPHAP